MSKSKTTKKTSAPKVSRSVIAESLEQRAAREVAKAEIKRKRLLARVAAPIAVGIMNSPSSVTRQLAEGELPDFVADASVVMAEAILKRVGL
jgi:hypothetical protein